MLHADDGADADAAGAQARREWMESLACAPLALLEEWHRQSGEGGAQPQRSWLRRPETGLVMLRARAGGTGEKFNLGEMTITRCALRLESGEVGIAYLQGRSHRKAELAALADALLQSAHARESVRRQLLAPIQVHLEAAAASLRRKAQSTRVDFLTLARGAGD